MIVYTDEENFGKYYSSKERFIHGEAWICLVELNHCFFPRPSTHAFHRGSFGDLGNR